MDVLQPSEIREGYCALPYSSVSSPSTSRSASLSWLSFVLHIAKPVPVTNKDMFGFNSKALYYFFPSVPYRIVRDVQVQFFPVTRRQSGRIRVYVLRVICEFRFHMLFRTLLNCYSTTKITIVISSFRPLPPKTFFFFFKNTTEYRDIVLNLHHRPSLSISRY